VLRTEQDRGTITLLDRRLVTQRYGKAILNALPPFRRDFLTAGAIAPARCPSWAMTALKESPAL
jgi:Rad3-related DNA helicase